MELEAGGDYFQIRLTLGASFSASHVTNEVCNQEIIVAFRTPACQNGLFAYQATHDWTRPKSCIDLGA